MKINGLNYKDMKSYLRRQKATSPTFTRSGTAYDGFGKQVAANQPRFGPHGLLIEVGTQNQFPLANSQTFSSPWTASFSAGVFGVSIQGTSGSLLVYNNTTSTTLGTVTPSTPLIFTLISTTSLTFTPTGNPTLCQIENSTSVTTWMPGGTSRSNEKLTIPSSLINLAGYTIEAEFYFPFAITIDGKERVMWDMENGSDELELYMNSTNHLYWDVENSTSAINNGGTVTITPGTHKFSFSCGPFRSDLIIDQNNQDNSTIIKSNSPQSKPSVMTIGTNQAGTNFWINAYLKQFVISNKERSVSEMILRQTNSKFPVDKYVNYVLPLQKDLSAIGEPAQTDMPVMVNVSQNTTGWNGVSYIDRLNNGTLCCFYRKSSVSTDTTDLTAYGVMRTSTDGVNWSAESTVAQVTGYDTSPYGVIHYTYEGTETILVLLSVESSTIQDTYITKATVTNGVIGSFSTPVLFANNRCGGGNPILLSNGNIVFVAYGNNPITLTITGVIYLETSTDGANTWTETLIGTNLTTALNESSIIETKTAGAYTGGLLVVARSESGTAYSKFTSTNYGANWTSESLITEISHYSLTKGQLYRHDGLNANVILFATTDNIQNLNIWKSFNEGGNWQLATTIRIGPTNTMYPDLLYMSDTGTLIVTWSPKYNNSVVYVNLIPKFLQYI